MCYRRGTSLSGLALKKTSWVVAAATVLVGTGAWGAEVTRVVSALDDDNRFDFNLTATWFHQSESSFVKRESQSALASTTEIIKDLQYARTRDVLNLRGDFGILWDVGLHVQVPIVLSDTNNLSFDQSGGAGCIYPGDALGLRPTCVNQNNSTILRDGILPGFGASEWGLNSPHNRTYSGSNVNGVFESPNRRGPESLGVGVTWAAFNERRDDTKPTWTLSFDALLDVFKDMRFDPSSPLGNTGVGLGYHQMVFSTWVSKRFRHFDPFVGAWYDLPIRTNGSPFHDYGATQTSVNPQQQAGVVVGVEQIAWEDAPAQQRVTIEARAHMQEYFYGRGRSEIWEPLAGSSQCRGDNQSACRPGIDLDLDGNGLPDAPHPGITDIEAYMLFGGDVGLNVQVGRYIRFHGLFGVTGATPHYITAAGAGVPASPGTPVNTQDPSQANPVYREAIDLPGRRFRVEGTRIYSVLFEGSLMF